MSDTLGITIKVDAGNTKTTVDGVEQSLAKVEDRGDKIGPAIEKGMKQGSSAAEKAKASLDGLHESGLKVEGSLGQAVGGRFGELGNIMGEIGSKGTIAAAGLVALGAELIHINDEYIQLENSASRLASSQGMVNSTIHEQLDLAGDLHGSLEQTMELSIAVKERTEDLNLTHSEQIALTRVLGEQAQLTGHSLGEAASVLQRVGFALEEGLPAGRQMKQLFMEFPIIADAMSAHFHMTQKEIIELAQKGQLSMDDFVAAELEATSKTDAAWKHHAETFSQTMGHVKDSIDVAVGELMQGQTIEEMFAAHTHNATDAWKSFTDELNKPLKPGNALDAVRLGMKQWQDAEEERLKGHEARTAAAGANLGDPGLMGMLMGDKKGGEGSGFDLTKKAMHGLSAEMEEEKKILKEMNGAEDELNLRLDALHGLLDKGKIDWQEYGVAVHDAMLKAREAKGLGPGGPSAASTAFADQAAFGASTTAVGALPDEAGAMHGLDLLGDKKDSALVGLKEYEEQAKKTATAIQSALKPVGDMLVNAAKTGKISWSDFGNSVEDMLLRLIEKTLEEKAALALAGLLSGPTPGGFDVGGGGGAGSVVAAIGSMGLADGGRLNIPHFAAGGMLTPMRSGRDDHLLQMFVNTGERVTVENEAQQRAAAANQNRNAAPSGNRVTEVHIPENSRAMTAAYLGSDDGERDIIRIVRKHRGAL